jgi:hypothetical protein
VPLPGGGSHKAAMPAAARLPASRATWFHKLPSAGKSQWKYCIIVPLLAMAFPPRMQVLPQSHHRLWVEPRGADYCR